jgi:hypothetical protein
VNAYSSSAVAWGHCEEFVNMKDVCVLQILIVRPPDYFGTALWLIPVLLLGGLVYMKRDSVEYLYNKSSWAAVALVSASTELLSRQF